MSEKTLELNLCAEMLADLRGPLGFRDAFWIGFTQQQEDRRGLDEVLMGLPPSRHLALQFKAPNPTAKEGAPYRFKIDIAQCQRMLDLSARRSRAVYYVLPAFKRFPLLRQEAPNLLTRTRFFPVEGLRAHGAAAWAQNESHHLALDDSLQVSLESEPVPLGAVTWEQVAEEVSEGLETEALRAWITETLEAAGSSGGDLVGRAAFLSVPSPTMRFAGFVAAEVER